MMNQNIQQAHIFFSGIVQGVGFRYNARDYAVRSGLNGWVRNLSDGRVEACVQGDKDSIEEFCRNLQAHYDGSLRSVDMAFEPSDNRFEDFRILL